MTEEVSLGEVEQSLTSWQWRFQNLYHIKPADKRSSILFIPKPEQWEILEAVYERGEVRIAILKARQLGFSTLIALITLDMAMWNAGFIAGIVDQNQSDAKRKLEKIYFAWKRLPQELKDNYQIEGESKSEFAISARMSGDNLDEKSIIYAGTNARGGTHQLLWISEWGPIQVEDASRSDKIADGALPSAEDGIIIVETTWRGGRTGRLYTEVVKNARELDEKYRTVEDWKIYFFAWWRDQGYVFDGEFDQMPQDCLDYFAEIKEQYDLEFTQAQMLWYFKKAWVKGHARFEEFPTVIDEIFDTPVQGAIYAPQILQARMEGRVLPLVPDEEALVHTTWDLGSPENTVVYYWQKVGFFYHLLDCDHDLPMTTAERVSHMHSKGYNFGHHCLPHDGSSRGSDALSFARKLQQANLQGKVVKIDREVHKAEAKRIGIMLDLFSRIRFNADTLDQEGGALDALATYRYKKSPKDGRITNEIEHDWSSHHADAFGYLGEAVKKRRIPDASGYFERAQVAETPIRMAGRRRGNNRQSQALM